MEKSKLEVSFDDPEHGWCWLDIAYGSELVEICASYIPHDSFYDLIMALSLLLSSDGEAIVIWHAEPIEYELRFSRKGEIVSLIIMKYIDFRRSYIKHNLPQPLLEITGSYKEICIPFWKALLSLQGRFTEDELRIKCHREFPWRDLNKLNQKIHFWVSVKYFL